LEAWFKPGLQLYTIRWGEVLTSPCPEIRDTGRQMQHGGD
jgi:hypothetical protein